MFISNIKTISSENAPFIGNAIPQRFHLLKETLESASAGGIVDTHKIIKNTLLGKEDYSLLSNLSQEGKSGTILAAGAVDYGGRITNYIVDEMFPKKRIPMDFASVDVGKIGNLTGFNDYMTVDGTACTSGHKVMFEAKMLMALGVLDNVLHLSIDDTFNNYVISLFNSMGVTVSRKNEEAGLLPSAFDSSSGGFNLGQGAGYMVLTKERSRDSVAEVLASTIKFEKIPNPVGQSENGEGYHSVITALLEEAGLKPSDIDFIKTHGSGTSVNNKAERAAIENVFGKNFKANSYKQYVGHTLGSNVAVEIDLVMKDSRAGLMRRIKNRTEPDENFISEDYAASPEIIMTLSAGLGNSFGGAILRMI